jgi:hypothetical protein
MFGTINFKLCAIVLGQKKGLVPIAMNSNGVKEMAYI